MRADTSASDYADSVLDEVFKTGVCPENTAVRIIPAKQNAQDLTKEIETVLGNLKENSREARVLDVKYSYSATETFMSSSRGWYSAMLILHFAETQSPGIENE